MTNLAAKRFVNEITVHAIVGNVHVYALGKPGNYYVGDWTKHSSFAPIHDALSDLGLSSVAMLKPGFNGVCVRRSELCLSFSSHGTVIEIGTAVADSIILEPGRAAAWASGDCHTIVISNRVTGEAAAIHGGRYSLLPLRLRPQPRRISKNQSEDDVITTTIRHANWNPRDLTVFCGIGIGSDHFRHPVDDPKYGAYNRHMIAHAKRLGKQHGIICIAEPASEGRLIIAGLVRAICLSIGIPNECITEDGVDTYADLDHWFSNRRGDTEGRQFVAVINC